MNDLSPEDEALLELSRGGHEPTAEQRARARTRMIGRLGIAAGLATGTAAGTAGGTGTAAAATVAASAGLFTAGKIITALAVVAAVGVGGVASYRVTTRPQAAPVSLAPSAAPPAEVALSTLPAPTASSALAAVPSEPTPRPPLAPSALPPSSPSSPSSPVVARRAETRSATVPALAPASAPASPPSTLEAEATLLREGVTELHAGRPSQALALLDEHARRFPASVLAEERAAERIFALCDLHRTDEAGVARASFLRMYSGSPLVSRVDASCGARTNP